MPRPYTHKRYCIPPLIRSGLSRTTFPQGKANLRRPEHFYAIQPYTPSVTFGDTSPYTPGGSASLEVRPAEGAKIFIKISYTLLTSEDCMCKILIRNQ